MRTMKQFYLGFLALGVIFTLSFLTGCKHDTSGTACRQPHPLVTFDAKDSDGFSVTPDTLSGATTVTIDVTGKSGAGHLTINGHTGEEAVIVADTSFHRPLFVKFTYKSADNQVLAEDGVWIEDRPTQGITIPDMDVVVAFNPMNSCPGTSQVVSTATSNGVTEFTWNTSDTLFEVSIIQGGVQKKFVLKPTPVVGDNSGKVQVFEHDQQACLTDLTFQPVSSKEANLLGIDSCAVRGYNDGSVRKLKVRHKVNAVIGVRK